MSETASSFHWSTAERRAWKPRPTLLPSVWAERHRTLTRQDTARGVGRWKNSAAPYLVGIMDITAVPGLSRLVIMKPAQVGASEALRNVMGCWSDQSPDPMGLALPNLVKGRQIVSRRIIPMFQRTRCLRDKLTEKAADITKGLLQLTDHSIALMWAGSASSMSSDPMRRAVCDEVDKFTDWAGKEADPISLIVKRLRTYSDRALLVVTSTPTTRTGPVAVEFDLCGLQFYYYWPCPTCGVFQRPVFAQVKWEKPEGLEGKALADFVTSDDTACWYECEHCKARIHEPQKYDMVQRGRWQTEDGRLLSDFRTFPPGTRVGMHVPPAFIALWPVTFAEVAAEYLLAKGNFDKHFAFVTQTLGEPFEQQIKRTASNDYSAKCQIATLDEGIIPRWAVGLVATIDTQHDHFWMVIRAWGPAMRSHRVFHGRVPSFADIEALCWGHPWAVEGDAFPPKICDAVWIDTGGTKLAGEEVSRTMQVYEWCLRMRGRATPVKGADEPKGDLMVWFGEGLLRRPGERAERKLRLNIIATHKLNDALQSMIDDDGDAETGRPPQWELNTNDDPEYNSHMSSVQKVLRRKAGKQHEVWVPSASGARIDYRDCEVYQVAAAYHLRVHELPSEAEIAKMRAAQAEQIAQANARRPQRERSGGWDVRGLGGHLR